jgi:hypothetical protein
MHPYINGEVYEWIISDGRSRTIIPVLKVIGETKFYHKFAVLQTYASGPSRKLTVPLIQTGEVLYVHKKTGKILEHDVQPNGYSVIDHNQRIANYKLAKFK